MDYDIMAVGYEYMEAEELRKNGDIENAIKHYELAIEHYENADNEYMLSPNSPYTEEVCGKTISFPSVNKMISNCHNQIHRLKRYAEKAEPPRSLLDRIRDWLSL